MDEDGLQVWGCVEEPQQRARGLSAGRLQLDDDEVALGPRPEALEVDPERDERVLALEALCSRLGRLRGRREQGVDPGSQPVASRAPRRVSETVDGEERRRRQGVRRREREVREARQARLEPVDDVEAAVCQRKPQVCPDGDRNAHVRAP